METAQVSIKRWVDKTTMGHLHNRIELGCKKEEKFTLCYSMNGPEEHSAKWNKPVRQRTYMYNPWTWTKGVGNAGGLGYQGGGGIKEEKIGKTVIA